MTIYEGTTGMQALDFLTRRLWRDEGRGLALFLQKARDEIDAYSAEHPQASDTVLAILDGFELLSDRMSAMQSDPDAALYRADSYMRAAWAAVSAWMALRMSETRAVESLSAQFAFHSARCG